MHERSALAYYLSRYHHSTEEEWRAHFAAGRIQREGLPLHADAMLRHGDTLSYHRPPWEEEDVPTHIPLLASGEGWMVFDKPSGLPVLPGGGFLLNTMLHLLRERYGQELAPVHRLGRGTSGAILFSSHAQAAAMLSAALRDRRMQKTYLALVQGMPERDHFTIDVPIGKVPHPKMGGVFAAARRGKASLSHCRVLRRDVVRSASLLAVTIPTGRPHQIRIHCAAAGHPLVGDPLYGPDGLPVTDANGHMAVPGDCGYHLHSWRLAFPLPEGEGMHEIIAPPPPLLDPGNISFP